MQIPTELVAVFLGVWLAINGWQCKEIISLKISVARIKDKLHGSKRKPDETEN